jgi:hypothetical protein
MPPPPPDNDDSTSVSDDDGVLQWYEVIEDNSVPDELELKEIEEATEHSALDGKSMRNLALTLSYQNADSKQMHTGRSVPSYRYTIQSIFPTP